MKLAFFYNERKLTGFLTRIFTGSYCYHVAFVDEEYGEMYDMSLIRRIRIWPLLKDNDSKIILVDTPVSISRDFLMHKLKSDDNVYGWFDYFLFALRPIYHFFGKSTRNAKGIICSEMVYNDLFENGWNQYFIEVPSPADLEEKLIKTI